jgi:hypothetical protein
MTDLKWLKSLKDGDEAVIVSHNYGNHPYRLVKVDKVSPSGLIMAGDMVFSSDGWERGATNQHSRDHIIKPTQEILDEIKVHNLKRMIQKWVRVDMVDAPLEKLLEVWSVMRK